MGLESELIDKGASVPLVRDIYGTPRDSVADIGPVEFNNNAGIFPPEAPYNFGID